MAYESLALSSSCVYIAISRFRSEILLDLNSPTISLRIITTFISGYQSILQFALEYWKGPVIIFICIFWTHSFTRIAVQFRNKKCIYTNKELQLKNNLLLFSEPFTQKIFLIFLFGYAVMREKMNEWKFLADCEWEKVHPIPPPPSSIDVVQFFTLHDTRCRFNSMEKILQIYFLDGFFAEK